MQRLGNNLVSGVWYDYERRRGSPVFIRTYRVQSDILFPFTSLLFNFSYLFFIVNRALRSKRGRYIILHVNIKGLFVFGTGAM